MKILVLIWSFLKISINITMDFLENNDIDIVIVKDIIENIDIDMNINTKILQYR